MPDYTVWAVLEMLLCCFPFGLAGLILSHQSMSANFARRSDIAEQKALYAKRCLISGAIISMTILFLAAAAWQIRSASHWKYRISHGKITIEELKDKKTDGAVVIPYRIWGMPITTVENWAFLDCTDLTSVTIPQHVTKIGVGAFAWCRGLTSFTIPPGVTSIEAGTFQGCENLTSLTIPNGVTSIGDSAFCLCSRLKSIRIPKSVTNIGYDAFQNCEHLTILTPTGSAAEAYAKKNNIRYTSTD